MRNRLFAVLVVAALAAIAPGCTPVIGDGCNTSTDCSINGDRSCDLARPGGSCTVFACESGNCPDNAVCVRWRPDPSRLSFTACMRTCTVDANCRVDQGYRCLGADELLATPEGGDPIAEVVDTDRADEGRFCVSTDPDPDL